MKRLIFIFALILSILQLYAQKDTTAVDSFRFTTSRNKITPIKDQASSGTCWSSRDWLSLNRNC
jgi:C1A family cysteine protease